PGVPVSAHRRTSVVVPRACGEFSTRRIHDRAEALALVQPFGEHDGLPRRTDLEAVGPVVGTVHVVVQLRVDVLLPYGHRVLAVLRHGDDVTGARLDRHGGVAGPGGVAHRHAVLDRFVRRGLDIGVDRRLDRETAAV